MAENQEAVIVEPQFLKIVDGVRGAEGPVFGRNGNFFMVAPGIRKDGKFAGQVLKVDLIDKQVPVCLLIKEQQYPSFWYSFFHCI